MKKIEAFELPLIVSQTEKLSALEQRAAQAIQAYQQAKDDLRAFIQSRYGVDIEAGEWELDTKTGELRERA